MFKKSYFLLVLITIFLLVIYFIRIRDIKKQELIIQKYNDVLLKQSITESELENSNRLIDLIYQAKLNDTTIYQFFKHYPKIKQCIYDSKKLVFYFNKNACGSCIMKILQDLEILGNIIGKENIIVLSNLGKKNKPIKNENYNFKQYYIDPSLFPFKSLNNNPIIFTTDSLLNANLLYIPSWFPNYQQKYFTEILPNYFNKN